MMMKCIKLAATTRLAMNHLTLINDRKVRIMIVTVLFCYLLLHLLILSLKSTNLKHVAREAVRSRKLPVVRDTDHYQQQSDKAPPLVELAEGSTLQLDRKPHSPEPGGIRIPTESLRYQTELNLKHARMISQLLLTEGNVTKVKIKEKEFRKVSEETVTAFKPHVSGSGQRHKDAGNNYSLRSMLWPTDDQYCPLVPRYLLGSRDLKNIKVSINANLDDIEKQHWDVELGGKWSPSSCKARHKVALIIPFRARWTQFTVLLKYLIPFLKRQMIDFRIFLAEQGGNETFNKGSVMNAAFKVTNSMDHFDCFIFHDTDLLPEDDRNMYTCGIHPKHLAVEVDTLGYQYWYYQLAGGVLVIKPEHFLQINGYSNLFWGWGGEDDDIGKRIIASGLHIFRPNFTISRYSSVPHEQRPPMRHNMNRKLLDTSFQRYLLDGLNTLQMTVESVKLHQLFTHIILSDVGKPPENLLDLMKRYQVNENH